MRKKVLVTGASGLIGHHCLQPLLDRGYDVHAVGRDVPSHGIDDVTWHRTDLLTDAGALVERIEPTHLLHLAWQVVPGQFAAPENFDWVAASMDMLRSFTGDRVLMCGSGYEYDWDFGYCSEGITPLRPATVYGSCKHALQTMVGAWADHAGVSSAWGRVFFVYGPREHPDRLVASVIRALLHDEPALCSHGRQIRDYLHVQDVADGLVATLDSPVEGPVNICSGQATTLRDIVLAIGDILGKPDLIRLGALPARPNDTPLVVGHNGRLVGEVGWEQTFDLRDGLEHTIDWWKQNL
ncbi:NAD-dependent epimerase/dehydratase family protein [Mycolicibacterium thermoresistibile]